MYSIFKAVIESKRFELTSMLEKIDTIWVQGGISDDQRADLINLARSCAVAANSYPSIDTQMEKLFAELASVKEELRLQHSRISALENEPVETPEPEEWPEFVAPTGAHDAYKIGDKISFNGKHYKCRILSCVWSPDTYPLGWELVE